MFVAIITILWGILTGHATYYGQPHNPALNGGVVVDVAPGQCVGYEWFGHPGFFGNTDGLTGGDCE